jgi:hypothetical protein
MRVLKYILFVLLVAGMLIPAIQKDRHPFDIKPLNGDFVLDEEPRLSTTTWMDGSFQTQFDSYLEQHIGFRPLLVRLNNQIEYSFYDKMSNNNIVKGKDDYLYERWFINTYYGKDFVGVERIENQVAKLIAIDSVLKSKGILLIVALAPGKADVFPEKIPDFMIGNAAQHTNYKVYRDKLNATDITIFDINKWFIQTKPEFERNLFTKGGTHWSQDAAMMALDSLLKRVENESGELRNQIQFDSITKTQIPKDPDNDILKISNLLFNDLNTDYYYPEIHFEETHPKRGKLISISDSFFWILFNSKLNKTFIDVKYWYYFNTVFPESFKQTTTVNNISIATELMESDVVLIMCSPANLKKIGWGFIDQTHDLLVNGIDKELAIEHIIASIKSDPKWYASVKAKAVKRNIELDSMLRLDAEYVYKRK